MASAKPRWRNLLWLAFFFLTLLWPIQRLVENYYLEVSSPGAERPLKKQQDFEKAIGQYIYVKTYEPVKDLKEFYGYLRAYTDEFLEIEIRIKTRKLTIQIEKEKIAQARLAIDFSDKQI